MRFIKNWILATFILTFLVIIAGGVVRTTQSGMGCPDWPHCFGKWIPPTNASELPPDFEKYLSKQDIDHSFNALHTWIEYVNRLLGALLGLFALIQTALLFLKRKTLRKPFFLSLGFLVIVILTGLFGAIVVKLNLANLSISVHLLFAVILIQIQLALLLAIHARTASLITDAKTKNLLWVFLAVLIIQSVMGTMVRMHVDDISKMLDYQQREKWLSDGPVVFLIHRSFSWIVLIFSLYLAWYGKLFPAVKKQIFVLASVILLSMITGIVLSYADMPKAAQPIHLLLATFAITQCFSILFQIKNNNGVTSGN